ncbi:deoxyribose-phosphate aldolase [Aureimonas sp. AU20]|uniref:deoxyribose-phosphate aldolase n=1 Tax=Aureimonas sp. AU20 TaxID=1349819 RepID=UPI0007220984|nr:deoxyribose-phosphate aldolase [Aureimonas sp. AU20]ALN71944.1 hypothetical protein M673_04405 [Aureimonas sp. AU20]
MSDRATEARQLIACLDLTDLNEDCTSADVETLVRRASTPEGDVAAICIWPRFVAEARAILPAGIQLATVVNFPGGGEDVAATIEETRKAVADGADEIDLVISYRRVAADPGFVEAQVRAVKEAAGTARLKAILETGELADPDLILSAAEAALEGGADFLKTSTGKVPVSATPEAAGILLQAIANAGGRVGFKPSGGIRRFEDAKLYRDMAEEICGPGWATPDRFRLGASGVLTDLLCVAGAAARGASAPGGY